MHHATQPFPTPKNYTKPHSKPYSKSGDNMVMDPIVKMYDIRTMKSLAPIAFPSGPSFLRFHPKFSSTLFVTSLMGQVQICDIGGANMNDKFFQV